MLLAVCFRLSRSSACESGITAIQARNRPDESAALPDCPCGALDSATDDQYDATLVPSPELAVLPEKAAGRTTKVSLAGSAPMASRPGPAAGSSCLATLAVLVEASCLHGPSMP